MIDHNPSYTVSSHPTACFIAALPQQTTQGTIVTDPSSSLTGHISQTTTINNSNRNTKSRLHATFLPPQQPPIENIIPPSFSQQQQVVPSSLSPLLSQQQHHQLSSNFLSNGIHSWLTLIPPANAATTTTTTTTTPAPPTDDEVALLRDAFAALYGEKKNLVTAESLLDQVIVAWERQNPDEKAAVYRVRGDCYMELSKPTDAISSYTTALTLLSSPGGELADPTEKLTATLGRARATRLLLLLSPPPSSSIDTNRMASDYQTALLLSARGDDDDFENENEKIADGAMRNPYVAWEYAAALRSNGEYRKAASVRSLAVDGFDAIGDRARKVLSSLDRGVDLAIVAVESKTTTGGGDGDDGVVARAALEGAIKKTPSVEGRDVGLLQRVIAKEGEARVALASLLWDDATMRGAAEKELGEACLRLDQLERDAEKREAKLAKRGGKDAVASTTSVQNVAFSIDGGVGAGEISCSRFKNEKFLTERLEWPKSLREKAGNLQKLGT